MIMRKTINICTRLNRRIDVVNIVEIMLLVSLLPLTLFGQPQWFYENCVAENIQIMALIAAIYVCLGAKRHKELFVVFAFISLFCILREINMARNILSDLSEK